MRIFRVMMFIGAFGFFCAFAVPTSSAAPLTYRYQHYIFTINPAEHPEWRVSTESWTYNGIPFDPPAKWRVDGDAVPPLPAGVERRKTFALNRDAIERTVDIVIGKALDRPAGSVVIRRDDAGAVVFDGVGLTGRTVDGALTADLTLAALDRGLSEVALPVTETQPHVRVEDLELASQGVKEVVTIGESVFAGSPVNRRHNIGVGLKRFNGTVIPANSTFSFNAILGVVDGSTGYKKELVIKGDRTEPDYGGGLCQISTTAYRGIWEYGFPIERRKNHSYTVRYYAPAGTDATVYPGAVDMVFTNDLPTPLVIQTHQENDRAYFIYYGARDDRKTEVLGPFVFDRADPPPDKIELTTDLPPGERKKLNERVPGMKTLWYRFVTAKGKTTQETVYSHYEARPLFTAVGVAELPSGYGQPPANATDGTSSSAASSSTSSVAIPRSGTKPPSRR